MGVILVPDSHPLAIWPDETVETRPKCPWVNIWPTRSPEMGIQNGRNTQSLDFVNRVTVARRADSCDTAAHSNDHPCAETTHRSGRSVSGGVHGRSCLAAWPPFDRPAGR